MKFAAASSFILLAFSLAQLTHALPVPAPLPDSPYKRTANETDGGALDVNYRESVIF